MQAEDDGKTPPFIGTDLKVGNQWQQYDKAKFTPGSQGKFRIIRQGGVMSTYALDGTKWVRLDRFNGGGFSEPATIWLYVWNGETNDAAAFTTTFTLEQIATGDRVHRDGQVADRDRGGCAGGSAVCRCTHLGFWRALRG